MSRLKAFVRKRVLSRTSPQTYERLLAAAVMEREFSQVFSCREAASREAVWDVAVERLGAQTPVSYLEFGVYQGYSFRYFLSKFSNPASEFVGFDSFIGLPEDWSADKGRGAFNVGGKVPELDDPRGRFVPGWFQNTFSVAAEALQKSGGKPVVVHCDADIFTSTLFLMMGIHGLVDAYHCIFDEFSGHECRALYTYLQTCGADVEFIAATRPHGTPSRVLAHITTNRGSYAPAGMHP